MNPEIIKRNTASREAMKKLSEHLSNSELERTLPNGWTVGVMFAPLAFWDKQRLELLLEWEKNGISPVEYNPDVFNAALFPVWELLEPRLCLQMALENAEALDKFIESLPDDFVKEMQTTKGAPDLDRANHRLHHLKQLR
ncbi:MAG: hypothetical protein ACRCYY_07515 [Trueperaceae bacterium]